MVMNPAIQQKSSCPVCGLNYDISQCKKEEAILNAEATKRAGNFLVQTKLNSPRPKQECEERTDEHYGSSSGCFMCLAFQNPRS